MGIFGIAPDLLAEAGILSISWGFLHLTPALPCPNLSLFLITLLVLWNYPLFFW